MGEFWRNFMYAVTENYAYILLEMVTLCISQQFKVALFVNGLQLAKRVLNEQTLMWTTATACFPIRNSDCYHSIIILLSFPISNCYHIFLRISFFRHLKIKSDADDKANAESVLAKVQRLYSGSLTLMESNFSCNTKVSRCLAPEGISVVGVLY